MVIGIGAYSRNNFEKKLVQSETIAKSIRKILRVINSGFAVMSCSDIETFK